MDRRLVLGLGSGALGVAIGVAATIWETATLAVLAGALVLVALVAVVRLVQLLHGSLRRVEQLSEQVDELQSDLQREARARGEAEQRLAARIQLTAMRHATASEQLSDAESGLYSEGYFTVALDARVAAARRSLKPLAVVVLEVVEDLNGDAPRPAEARAVAAGIRSTIRESDTACRLLDGGYALIFDDADENGAIWTVERIRRTLATTHPGLTIWAGVACYPAHGLDSEEILDRADMALDLAREWRQDRIEVATAAST